MKLSRIATLLPLALLGLAACHSGNTMDTLVANSDLTRHILDIYGRIFWWTVILFVVVQGGLIYIALRFRAREGDDIVQWRTVRVVEAQARELLVDEQPCTFGHVPLAVARQAAHRAGGSRGGRDLVPLLAHEVIEPALALLTG